MGRRLNIPAQGLSFELEEGETILEGLLRQHYQLPVSCRNGVCQLCDVELRSGSVRLLNQNRDITAPATVVSCLATLLSDCSIDCQTLYRLGEQPSQSLTVQCLQQRSLNAAITELQLRLPAGRQPSFSAGQYIQVELAPSSHRAYIANAPEAQRELTVHLEYSGTLPAQKSLAIHYPCGPVFLRKIPLTPIVILWSGDSCAHALSLLEWIFAQSPRHQRGVLPIYCIWQYPPQPNSYPNYAAQQWQEWQSRGVHTLISHNDGIDQLTKVCQPGDHQHSLALLFPSRQQDYLTWHQGLQQLGFTENRIISETGYP